MKKALLSAVIVLIGLIAALSVAGTPVPEKQSASQPGSPVITGTEATLPVAGATKLSKRSIEHSASPMFTEIKSVLAASRTEVARLSEQLKTASGDQQIMALQRDIARVKSDTRLEVFRIQLRYAVAEDRQEDVEKLETLLTQMTTSRPHQTPTRPAPVRAAKP